MGDIFLKLTGIEGEAKDVGHVNELELLSYSFGVDGATSSSGGGGGAGKSRAAPLNITKRVDKSLTKLFLACASGLHIKEGLLSVRQGEGQFDFLRILFSDLVVSHFDEADTSGEIPVDSATFTYAKILITYQQTNQDGSPGPIFSSGWDFKQNRAV